MELTLDRLSRQFGPKIAVDRASAGLTPGVHGLLGANGAGKTTLMRMICDVLRPTSGQVLYNGQEVHSMGNEYRARLGYLPQDFGYYPGFTALDFMEYMASLKGVDKYSARKRCLDLLDTVGLRDEAKAKVGTFSGGMKQRLGIAQAVLNDPEILVLDEPTAGLDPKERVHFRNVISSFAQDRIVLLSTHIVSDIEYIADDILVMRAGTFIMHGASDKIIEGITGKVWECRVDTKTADKMAVTLCVSNVRYADDGQAIVRFVTDEVPGSVVDFPLSPVEPTLEDLYLYVFRDGPSNDTEPTEFDRHTRFGFRSRSSNDSRTQGDDGRA